MTTQAQAIKAEADLIGQNYRKSPTTVKLSDLLFELRDSLGGDRRTEIENLAILTSGAAQMGHEVSASEAVNIFKRALEIIGYRGRS